MNNLTLTPALTELSIIPGAHASLKYTLTNSGPQTIVSFDMAPFVAYDPTGNIELQKPISIFDPNAISSWIKFAKTINLNAGETRDISLTITPPLEIATADYYLTLTATTEPNINIDGSGLITKTRIGSNLLLRIYGTDIKREAKIINFATPVIADSFFPVHFQLTVGNAGNTYIKPVGSIISQGIFGSQEFKLVPVNILAGAQRFVPFQGQTRFILGPYTSHVAFKVDESDNVYSAESHSFVFPFILVAMILIIWKLSSYLRHKTHPKNPSTR